MRRLLDYARLENFFKCNNCVIVTNARAADYVIFITCGFTKTREDECLRKISKLPKDKLIIAGCLPDIAPNRLKEVFNGKIIQTRNLDKIDGLFDEFNVKFNSIPDAHSYMSPLQLFIKNYEFNRIFFKKCLSYMSMCISRMAHVSKKLNKIPEVRKNIKKPKNKETAKLAYLRVSYGCIDQCAYCNISRAVGKLKSKSIDECRHEYSVLLKQGYRNFSLLADNLGAYGLDCASTFEELLLSLSEVDKEFSVSWRLEQLHPKWVIRYKDILSRYIAEGKIRFLLCPIQSGSNRILGLMNRNHSVEEITEIFEEFKKLQPRLYLFTHFIIGFPSETEEDLLASINIAKTIRFNEVQLFPYSDGYDSISSRMSDKIPEEKIHERLKKSVDFFRKEGIFCMCHDV